MTSSLIDLHCLANAWPVLLKGCPGSTSEWLVTSKNIQGFQVLVLGANHQLYKQVLVSIAEVKGTKHPAETNLICIHGLRYSSLKVLKV